MDVNIKHPATSHPTESTRRRWGLRGKLTLIFGLAFVVFETLEITSSKTLLMRGYYEIERAYVHANVQRVLNAFADNQRNLESLTTDHAYWDDTYTFMKTRDPAYLRSNYWGDTLPNMNVDFLIITDSRGTPVYQLLVGARPGQKKSVPRDLLALVGPHGSLSGRDHVTTGLVMRGGAPVLVSAAPILNSANRGPSRGMFVFGRFVNDAFTARIAAMTQLTPQLIDVASNAVPEYAPVLEQLREQSLLSRPISDEVVAGYGLLRDIVDQPGLAVQIELARDVVAQGKSSFGSFIGASVALGVTLCVVMVLILDKLFLRRLRALAESAALIGSQADLSRRVPVEGGDEIRMLAASINAMLDKLERVHAGPQRVDWP